MTTTKKQIKKSKLYSIIILERIFPHFFRHSIYKLEGILALTFILIILISYTILGNGADGGVNLDEKTLSTVGAILPKAVGVSLILIPLWALAFMMELFFRSYYLKDKREFDFEVALILYKAKKGDITKALLSSSVGKDIVLRLGVPRAEIKKFFKTRMVSDTMSLFDVQPNKPRTLEELAKFVFEKDKEFADYLFSIGVKENEFIGAAAWIGRMKELQRYEEKWWSRERLGRITPIGEDWAYGQTYLLDKYSMPILSGDMSPIGGTAKNENELNQLELILSRAKEANAIIVGEDGVGKMDIVYNFARRISKETAPKQLKHKKVVVLDTDLIIASTKSKSVFEEELIKIFNQAVYAGNIILVINNLTSFISSAKVLGSDVVSIIDPYLLSSSLQVIATSSTDAFHQDIEQNTAIMRRFEKIIIEEPSKDGLIRILEDAAMDLERRNRIIFTYPAILETITSAENYFTSGVMPDRAIDILIELTPLMAQKKKILVEKEDVWDFVRAKTHVPVGEIEETEREKLMNLEEILHSRVVGQDEAVSLVSSAMRRARTGVRNPKKPMGSFLFIGPTGVGKTETAKALAHAFFGDETAISRIDMSEYQTDDALSRLIGSFEDGKVGTLSTLLREKPYGVLLLDEFEKTNPDVHDLFLQILDEGFFSDMKGKRVNARNIIFIATSNAGSDLIWDAIERGEDISEKKDELISKIIERGRFKPELLNRFDGVVLFHPLNAEHLKKIAGFMLEKLRKRLRNKGVDLVVNDVLTDYVAKEGYNPTFGARPMIRAIQEKVEQRIADKMINGEIREGSKFEFSPEDLE